MTTSTTPSPVKTATILCAQIDGAHIDAAELGRILTAAIGRPVELFYHATAEFVEAETGPDAKEAIIYIPADDEAPYVLVENVGDMEGRELSPEEVDALREQMVVVGVEVEFPRVDRNGAPLIMSGYFPFSYGFVGSHGFACIDNLEANGDSTGDDSAERHWLMLAPKA